MSMNNLIERKILAKRCLQGLSIGDAFGESFFGETTMVLNHIDQQTLPETTWEFTDDTIMAIGVYQQLLEGQEIDQEALAQAFVRNHNLDSNRGYGATARRVLREIEAGGHWKTVSEAVFDGMGSMGNGAAMRVAPIGAFYYDNLEKVKALAQASAVVTHAHLEAGVGAMAIAVAAALATRLGLQKRTLAPADFIRQVVAELPSSDTASKINKALSISARAHPETLKTVLGNGNRMMAQDTVPFVIWCAAHNLYNYEVALWKTISVLGDRDTIAAMVGGIVVLSSEADTLPEAWKQAVEQVEKSAFMTTFS